MCLAAVFRQLIFASTDHLPHRLVELVFSVGCTPSRVPTPFGITTVSTVYHPIAHSQSVINGLFSGLIRWKIVLHAFIDGFSRLVTGIRASNNNRAQTVLDLFNDIVEVFGMPSRGRGDHGIENLLVAACMEAARGVERGSYIWGRYVLLLRYDHEFLAYGITGVYITFVLNASGVM